MKHLLIVCLICALGLSACSTGITASPIATNPPAAATPAFTALPPSAVPTEAAPTVAFPTTTATNTPAPLPTATLILPTATLIPPSATLAGPALSLEQLRGATLTIQGADQKEHVITLKDGKFQQREVQVLKRSETMMVLAGGVQVGEQVALADPLDPAKSDEINFIAKRDVQIVVADPGDIQRAIERQYGQEDNESFAEILKELGDEKRVLEANADGDNVKAAEEMANQVPIVKFVNLVLQQAVQDRASDIHFEPFETEFRIRYRVDGALYEMAPPPKHLALPVASRIKIMANQNSGHRVRAVHD